MTLISLITEPTVELVASTRTDGAALARWLDATGAAWPSLDLLEWDGECVIEAAGRCCYWSYAKGRPTPAWFANVIGEGHTSVLRHASFTFAVAGVSRSLLQEIARHHHLDLSVLSQRYVNQTDPAVGLGMVVPPGIDQESYLFNIWACKAEDAATAYTEHVRPKLMDTGMPRKSAHEAARSILPECWETRFFISGNGEAWRTYLAKRLPEGVDAEHRRLARIFLAKLQAEAPHIFAGLDAPGAMA